MSLYSLSLSATCRALDTAANVDYIDELPVLSALPIPLQCDIRREIKRTWIKHSTPSENPHLYEYRYLNFNTLDKVEFIMLMKHPRNLHPEFWPSYNDTAHLTMDYYELHIGNEKARVYCRPCFLKRCRPTNVCDEYDFDYAEYWISKNWRFFKVITHNAITPRWFVCNVMKSKRGWCDWCILTPLFQLYDFDTCTDNTHFHDEDSTDSSDSIVKVFNTTELCDPYHC